MVSIDRSRLAFLLLDLLESSRDLTAQGKVGDSADLPTRGHDRLVDLVSIVGLLVELGDEKDQSLDPSLLVVCVLTSLRVSVLGVLVASIPIVRRANARHLLGVHIKVPLLQDGIQTRIASVVAVLLPAGNEASLHLGRVMRIRRTLRVSCG